jgi:hypothetical protein
MRLKNLPVLESELDDHRTDVWPAAKHTHQDSRISLEEQAALLQALDEACSRLVATTLPTEPQLYLSQTTETTTKF